MNGYSKISNGTAQKTRPKDFSDFYYSFHPQTPKPQEEEEEEDDDESDNNKQVVKKEKEDGGVVGINNNNNSGERFGVVLGRSVSVSSSSSGFLQLGRVKRAFSMRRSSSVSERYCRIHDQYMAIAAPPLANNNNNNIDEDDHHQIIDDGDEIRTSRRRSSSMKMKKLRGGKIVKACKRLLGL